MILPAAIATLVLAVLAYTFSEWMVSRTNTLGRIDYILWQRYCDWADSGRQASIMFAVTSLILFLVLDIQR